MTLCTITTRARQEKRIRWQHGLSPSHARVLARLVYGDAAQ